MTVTITAEGAAWFWMSEGDVNAVMAGVLYEADRV